METVVGDADDNDDDTQEPRRKGNEGEWWKYERSAACLPGMHGRSQKTREREKRDKKGRNGQGRTLAPSFFSCWFLLSSFFLVFFSSSLILVGISDVASSSEVNATTKNVKGSKIQSEMHMSQVSFSSNFVKLRRSIFAPFFLSDFTIVLVNTSLQFQLINRQKKGWNLIDAYSYFSGYGSLGLPIRLEVLWVCTGGSE